MVLDELFRRILEEFVGLHVRSMGIRVSRSSTRVVLISYSLSPLFLSFAGGMTFYHSFYPLKFDVKTCLLSAELLIPVC